MPGRHAHETDPSAPLKRSYWLESAEPSLKPGPALQGEHDADVVIVGGGFVGLWTALTSRNMSRISV